MRCYSEYYDWNVILSISFSGATSDDPATETEDASTSHYNHHVTCGRISGLEHERAATNEAADIAATAGRGRRRPSGPDGHYQATGDPADRRRCGRRRVHVRYAGHFPLNAAAADH